MNKRESDDTPEPSTSAKRQDLTEGVVNAALALGFDRCTVAAVEEIPAAARLAEWLSRGMHGSMHWMERNPERRVHPQRVLAGARSVIIVALDYYSEEPAVEDPGLARISRYAWGNEYHAVLGERLEALTKRIQDWKPGGRYRWYVDTGPVLEKAWAEHSGLGWIGKHTNLITTGGGSWLFLGALLTDLPLRAGQPHVDRCGTCDRCIDACPTGAIVAPYVLDARLCISYLTIENRGPIPIELRRPMGNRVFGCDDCQDVCPWNRFARPSRLQEEFSPRADLHAVELIGLLGLSDSDFKEKFRGSPLLRAKRKGLARNVAVAIGNSGDPDSVPVLERALNDPEPLVRGHVAWALGEIRTDRAMAVLERCIRTEPSDEVIAEVARALQGPLRR